MKSDLHQIRPGDTLHLTVPKNYHLAEGLYRARVESCNKPTKLRTGAKQFTYHVSFPLDIWHDQNSEDSFRVHCQFTTYDHPELHGKGFLGPDQWPVEYSWEQSLERRLQESK